MKQVLAYTLFLILMVWPTPTLGQSSTPESTSEAPKCETSDILSRLDQLTASYLQSRSGILLDDSVAALKLAGNLQSGLEQLMVDCSGAISSTGTTVTPTQGKWSLTFSEKMVSCADGTTFLGNDRPVILLVRGQEKRLVVEDGIDIWVDREFVQTGDNTFYSRREDTAAGEKTIYEYTVTVRSASEIDGLFMTSISSNNCKVSSDFHLSLSDPSVVCLVSGKSNVNVRSGPGHNNAVVSSLAAGTATDATARAAGRDGFTWWKLGDAGWVRDDIVIKGGDCNSLPVES